MTPKINLYLFIAIALVSISFERTLKCARDLKIKTCYFENRKSTSNDEDHDNDNNIIELYVKGCSKGKVCR